MEKLRDIARNSVGNVAGLGAIALLLASCSSFHGPSPLVIGNSDRAVAGSEEVANPMPASEASGSASESSEGRGLSRPKDGLQLDWPVDSARLSRGFIASPAGRKRPHWGIDLANQRGTPILAAEKGTVIYTGRAFHGYGRLIVIEHGSDWATMYGHLDKILVKEGQTVERGEEIARMGRTGRATGVHLHFEVRRFRQPVNPLAYLPAIGSKVAGPPDANQYPLIGQESR